MSYREKVGVELVAEAKKLGVSLESAHNKDGTFREGAIQARVREARRSQRESRLWVVALVSAIASAFSALAAWLAVFTSNSW